MKYTTNYLKHTSKNPLQRYLIKMFYRNLVDVCLKIKPQNILDAGCGEGFTMEKLRLAKVGKKIIGIDNSQLALRLGRKIHPLLIIKKGDIMKLPFGNNSFDLVICSQVLEHIQTPPTVINELIRVSFKYCLITVPQEPIFRMANFLRGKYLRDFGNSQGHIQHWSKKEMVKLVKLFGLKIRYVASSFPWTIILAEK